MCPEHNTGEKTVATTDFVIINESEELEYAQLVGSGFQARYGWPSINKMIGMPFRELHKLHRFEGGDDSRFLRKLIDQKISGFSSLFTYENGNVYRYYLMHVEPRSDGIKGALIHYSEVPLKNLSKEQLIRKTNLNENLFRKIPTGVFFQDVTGRIRLANPAAEKMLGMCEAELSKVEKPTLPWKILDANGEAMPFENHPGNAALQTKKMQRNVVLQLSIKDGASIRWVKADSEPVFDYDTGELLGSITSFSDINEERLIKNALQSLTERTQIAIESANMGVWDWIPDQGLMIWDSKMFSLYGFQNDESVTPKDAFDRAIHPDDHLRVNKEIRLLIRGDRSAKLDFRVIWPDGSTHFLRAQARVVKDAKGRVERIIGVTHDVTKEVLSEERLRDMAFQDDLTSTLSRGGLKNLLTTLLQDVHARVGVVLVGLDRFKDINDNFGHPVGDELLKDMVKRLKRITGENMSLARLGGDEFAIVLESVSSSSLLKGIATQISESLQNPFYLDTGPVISVQASIGVSCSPADGCDTTNLLRAADLAMNHAKKHGGNCVVHYKETMLEEINKRYTLQNKLQEAVLAEDFMLYYQPIVDLNDSKVIGCEALIRWQDENGRFVSPMEFIPIVEECGLIYMLGKWICKTAIKQWKLWQQLVSDLEYVSINVSPLQLKQPTFVDELIELVEFHNVAPRHIQLEITEGTFLQESMSSDSALNQLANYGFRLAIDDFGTGYSSLAYLKRFNVDVIKVDRSFIIDIETDQSDRDIVSAIVAMNNKLGFKTLVEGIETEPQARILRELGIDSAQGYLYGKPTFADDFSETHLSKYMSLQKLSAQS